MRSTESSLLFVVSLLSHFCPAVLEVIKILLFLPLPPSSSQRAGLNPQTDFSLSLFLLFLNFFSYFEKRQKRTDLYLYVIFLLIFSTKKLRYGDEGWILVALDTL